MSGQEDVVFFRFADFRRDARKTTVLTDLRKRLQTQDAASVVNEHLVRQQEDWSFLSNQIVGAEDRASHSG